ncbi:MAG TPA: TIGR00159 family protein, partial [Ruminococcaceae bacterium]|nr:TIGR00159 family protein [Oscillospiraceae bacterium]
VIRYGRIYAAGCILPLTENNDISREMGTRHRAALGMSENSDAIVVVVSEETGTISIADNGTISRGYNSLNLRKTLEKLLLGSEDENGKRRFLFFKTRDKKDRRRKNEKK